MTSNMQAKTDAQLVYFINHAIHEAIEEPACNISGLIVDLEMKWHTKLARMSQEFRRLSGQYV